MEMVETAGGRRTRVMKAFIVVGAIVAISVDSDSDTVQSTECEGCSTVAKMRRSC